MSINDPAKLLVMGIRKVESYHRIKAGVYPKRPTARWIALWPTSLTLTACLYRAELRKVYAAKGNYIQRLHTLIRHHIFIATLGP